MKQSFTQIGTVVAIAIFAFGGFTVAHADGVGETGWFDTYEYYTPDTGWFDSSEYYTPDTGWYDTYEYYTPDTGWYDTYEYYTPDTGWYDSYEYYDYGTFDYGCGSYCGSTYSGGYGGYSGGCYSCGGGYSIPRYTPTVTVGQPARSSGGYSYYNSNTVSNTNVNNITNIDNSINDSFNNYNSNNTSLVIATPQTPVVYQQPAPYCTINHALAGGYYHYNNNSAFLSWTSTNATSAYLSNVGSVAVNGSQTVYPGYTTTYTLTVYGANGQSATCSTTVQGNTYIPPVQPPVYVPPVVQQPYVALTQIPYTGFDFGPIGNAMYWAALMSFAVAGAYLMVYYRGGALAFAGSMVGRSQKTLPAVVAPKAPILVEKEALAARAAAEARVAPIVASLKKAAGTTDSMAIVKSHDGSMPKIVINRG